MTKIKTYPPDLQISDLDSLTGNDYDKNNQTANFRVRELANFINKLNGASSFNYVFFFQSNDSEVVPPSGYFFSKLNVSQTQEITELYFSKDTFSGYDVTEVFQMLADNITKFSLRLSNPSNPNQFSYLDFTEIINNTSYFTLKVSFGNAPASSVLENGLTYVFQIEHKQNESVTSVNGQTGAVVLTADNIAETATRFWLTTALKAAYDSASAWVIANGATVLSHLSNTSNPHSVTKTQVGLGNVDNTSDANKPVSTATQTALNAKQDTLTESNFGTFSNSLTTNDSIATGDFLTYVDISDSNKEKKTAWSNIISVLTTAFNSVYQSTLVSLTNIRTVDGQTILGSTDLVTKFIPVYTTIVSTDLATQDINGLVTYINALSPVLTLATNQRGTFFVSDTGQTFELKLNGRSFGVAQSAITSSDILIIQDFDVQHLFLGDKFELQATGSAISNFGMAAPTTVGTGSNIAADFTAGSYPTSPHTFSHQRRSMSGAVVGNIAEFYDNTVRHVAVTYGFYAPFKITFDTSTNSAGFAGLFGSNVVTTNANPSALINILGFGFDPTDTNVQIMYNDASGAATKFDLGSNFAITRTASIDLAIESWNFFGSTDVYFRVKNLKNNKFAYHIATNNNVPASTMGLTYRVATYNRTDGTSLGAYFSNIKMLKQS